MPKPGLLVALAMALSGCAHEYRLPPSYQYSPTARLVHVASPSEHVTTPLKTFYRGLSVDVVVAEDACPADFGDQGFMGSQLARVFGSARYLGSIFHEVDAPAPLIEVPANRFVFIRNISRVFRLFVTTSCSIQTGFIPQANRTYTYRFRLGTSGCIVDIHDDEDRVVEPLDHRACEAHLEWQQTRPELQTADRLQWQ